MELSSPRAEVSEKVLDLLRDYPDNPETINVKLGFEVLVMVLSVLAAVIGKTQEKAEEFVDDVTDMAHRLLPPLVVERQQQLEEAATESGQDNGDTRH